MKKKYLKSFRKYSVSVIHLPPNDSAQPACDHAVKALNFKKVSEDNRRVCVDSNCRTEKESDGGKVIEFQLANQEGCDFETAIKATKYGKYNWFLLFVALWAYMSAMNSTTTMSLILPSAECDLELSNFDKGMLNSVVYVGMMPSGLLWGFVSDAVGRKNVLICILVFDTIFSILIGLAQNYMFLLIVKLISGFLNSSLIAILATYVAELHANEYRASVTIGMGIFWAIGSIILPPWLIIPIPINLVVFKEFLHLFSWHAFLLVSAIPSLLSSIGLLFFDESPKFLMCKGRNEEALLIFQKIYSANTGKPKETFTVKSLKEEQMDGQNRSEAKDDTIKQILWTGWRQVTPIFRKPYLFRVILPCLIQFLTILGMNTIRLWAPQLFATTIHSEKHLNGTSSVSSICDLLMSNASKPTENVGDCGQRVVSEDVYFNSMVTGFVTGIGYLIAGYLVKLMDRKWLLVLIYGLGVMCSFGIYWSTTSNHLLGTISVFIALISMAATTVSSVVIDTFPTFLRTTALSITLTFGRLGAVVGNLVFPLLLDLHCASPFIVLGAFLLVVGGLVFLLPNTKGEDLK
ncbi:hypothetical protein RUM44_005216 [Polyplax serrata]|uniref:Major facilitator superfamily (MFS) profile domain-containing protein n=1 Tax=Polyplax serrata TaxID=468196 RepID=A0ABR1AEE0_POLSC